MVFGGVLGGVWGYFGGRLGGCRGVFCRHFCGVFMDLGGQNGFKNIFLKRIKNIIFDF